MSIEVRLRALVTACGGRAPIARVVSEALGVAGAPLPLARRLAASAVSDVRGLAMDGDHVVERALPRVERLVALALAPVRSPTALPAVAAWTPVPATGDPVVVTLGGDGWRDGVAMLARDVAGADVLALSAATARRVLRLGALVANLDASAEPRVVALGPLARRAGRPLRSPADAAAILGAPPPESPGEAARMLARLGENLAGLLAVPLTELRDAADAEAVPAFDFGGRSFGRDQLRALPEAPGVYILEDAEGDVAYVGKAANLRRRVASYFAPGADERAVRVRDAAMGLTCERTGSELTALLREQQLIRELRPALNVQQDVHARDRRAPGSLASDRLAIIQPSAEGGAEVVLLDRTRGVLSRDVVPDAGEAAVVAALLASLQELGRRAPGPLAVDAEVVLSWLADRGEQATIIELPTDLDESASLLARLASDPDLERGRIVPVR